MESRGYLFLFLLLVANFLLSIKGNDDDTNSEVLVDISGLTNGSSVNGGSVPATTINGNGGAATPTNGNNNSVIWPEECHGDNYQIGSLRRKSFPPCFTFGIASSSYQYEGGAPNDGKGKSTWDLHLEKHKDRIREITNGKMLDSYHRYKEDVSVIKEMGLDAYRFSISWPRLLPNGSRFRGGVNQKGIDYYNNVINELIDQGITPYATLFHWDLPLALDEEYGGFISPLIADDFRDYAELCFEKFGDRVKYWVTLNEPWSYSKHGYDTGRLAPGRGCSSFKDMSCRGSPGREPYRVAHNLLLAHAAAVQVYREKYQMCQKGQIGITNVAAWYEPITDKPEDQKAAEREREFNLGWFLSPLTTGDYPEVMRTLVGKRLPAFDKRESKMIKRSYDFIGINYYTGFFVEDASNSTEHQAHPTYSTDSHTKLNFTKGNDPIGVEAGSSWLHIYPEGIYKLMVHIKETYDNPVIYITENGVDEKKNDSITIWEATIDKQRIEYHHSHLCALQRAMKAGVLLRGYFGWSLLDNFEWDSGETVRFGFFYVDYENGLTRYPKVAVNWFKHFLQKDTSNTTVNGQ